VKENLCDNGDKPVSAQSVQPKGHFYEFHELESEESFDSIGKNFGGIRQGDTFVFNTETVSGELIRVFIEPGLWIRKWRLNTFEKIILCKKLRLPGHERKYSLIYFLNPSLFDIKKESKKIPLNSKQNTILVSNNTTLHFSVIPRQPFYVLDISFSLSWLLSKFTGEDLSPVTGDADKGRFQKNNIISLPCGSEEYRILRELDIQIQREQNDPLFIRSRIYLLIGLFINKLARKNTTVLSKSTAIRYEEMVKVEEMLMVELRSVPSIDDIAKAVAMSRSSVQRQFKLMYGKTIQE
jgi:AraC-like DNA-binding protein